MRPAGLLAGERGMLLRFLLVGGAFAGIYALSTALAIGRLGAPAFAASVVCYALCIPAAFATHRRFTFRLDRVHGAGFAIYAMTQLSSLALVSFASTRFVTGTVLVDTLIFLVTAGAAAGLSFVVSRVFAFRPPA